MKKLLTLLLVVSCNSHHQKSTTPPRVTKISQDSVPTVVAAELPRLCDSDCSVIKVRGELFFCVKAFTPYHSVEEWIGDTVLYCQM